MGAIKTKDGIIIRNIPDGVSEQTLKDMVASLRSTSGQGDYNFQDAAQIQARPTETSGTALSEEQRAQLTPADPETSLGGALGGVARGAGIPAVAAGIGTVVGAPILAAERITHAITPIIADFINDKLGARGTKWEQMDSQEMYDYIMDKLNVPKPDTKAEQLSQAISTSVADAAGMVTGGQMMSGGPLQQATTATRVGEQLTMKPLTQLTGAGASVPGAMGGGAIADKASEILGLGEKGAARMNLAGQLIGGGAADLAMSGMTSPLERRLTASATPMSTKATEAIKLGEESLGPNEPALMRSELAREAFPSQAETTGAVRRATTPGGSGEMMYKRYEGNRGRMQDLMDDYGVEVSDLGRTNSYAEELMDDFLTERQTKLNDYVTMKKDVIQNLSSDEVVPVQNAVDYLQEQGARIGELKGDAAQKMRNQIEAWAADIDGLNLDQLERQRKLHFDALKLDEAMPDEMQQILREAYEYVVDDMGDYIKATGGDIDYNKWRIANRNLSEMASEFKDKALMDILAEGNKNPENMRVEDFERIFFSGNASDTQKLYDRLSPEGQGTAKMALMAKMFQESNPADMSPNMLSRSIQKYGNEIGIVMDADEVQRLAGLKKLFDITGASERLVRSETGAQLQTGGMPGAGAIASTAARKTGGLSILATSLGKNFLGNFAQRSERPAVRDMLAALAEATNPTTQTEIAKRLIRIINATDEVPQQLQRSQEQ